MKKLISLFLCILALSTMTAHADDFTSAQLKLRGELKQFLQEEGFMPEIDSDGDIGFKREGDKYYILIDEVDTSPFYVTLSKYFSYGEQYNRQNIARGLETLNLKKGVKTVLFDNSYALQAEMYLVSSDSFKYVFYKLMKQLDALENEIDSICSGQRSSSGGSSSGSYSGGSSSGSGSYWINEDFSSTSYKWNVMDGDLSFKNGKMIFEDVDDYGYSRITYDLPRNLINEDFELNFSMKISFSEDYALLFFILGEAWDDCYRFGFSKWGSELSLAFGDYGDYKKYFGTSRDAGFSPNTYHNYRIVKRGKKVEWYGDGILLCSTTINTSTDMNKMGFLVSDYHKIEVDYITIKLL